MEQHKARRGSLALGCLKTSQGGSPIHISKHFGIKASNEAEVLAILKALRIYCIAYQHSLTMESNLFNAISWVNSSRVPGRCSSTLMRSVGSQFNMLASLPTEWQIL